MTQARSVRFGTAALAILLLLVGVSCKRENQNGTAALTASLIFNDASSEVREALASHVDFRINDDNFARWSEAQSNLEQLPRAEIQRMFVLRGDAVDKAVARLESNPLTRQAIESAGLSVRDFVLETIALAQASAATQTRSSTSEASVPAENLQFVRRYSSSVLRSRDDSPVSRAESESDDTQSDAAQELTDQAEMQIQMQLDQAQHEVEMRLAEEETRRDEALNAAEMRREERERAAEMRREEAEMRREERQRLTEMRREEANARRERQAMLRDSLPVPR